MSFHISNKDGVPILVPKSVMSRGRDEVQRWADDNVELDAPVAKEERDEDEQEDE
jgi:hypothetical protein